MRLTPHRHGNDMVLSNSLALRGREPLRGIMKILAVDDDEIVLELLCETMRVAGFGDVTTATSARQAADILAGTKAPFDCICLDIQMPEVSGIDLCRWIRRQHIHQSTPIVMITTMSDRSYIDRAFAAGATDYVTKPFDALELVTRVRLAAKLSAETRRATDHLFAVKALRAQMDYKAQIDLAHPVRIEGVDGVVDLLALENYLLQLSRGSKFAMSVFAFKIAEVGKLHLRCSPVEFLDVLTDVADAITENLKFSAFFVAYAGKGAFVCVVDAVNIGVTEPEYLEAAVRHSIGDMDLSLNNGASLNVQIHMSQPQRLGLLCSGRAAVNSLYRAITDAEENCKAEVLKLPVAEQVPLFKYFKERRRAS